MRVFIIGASGYIGSAAADSLIRGGHTVVGLARSEASAVQLADKGIEVREGDITRPETVIAAARDADAVIQAASTGDARSSTVEPALAEALVNELQGSGKAFVLSSGVWVHGDTGGSVIDEASALNPIPLVAWRLPVEQRVLDASRSGSFRGIVIRPAVVYGGDPAIGIVASVVGQAKQNNGVARYVGSGDNYWTLVHVRDLGDLYARAVELATPGSVYIGVTENLVYRDIAVAVSRAAGGNGETESIPIDVARGMMGPFADALALNQRASGEKAIRELGWKPTAPSLLDELKPGGIYYRAS